MTMQYPEGYTQTNKKASMAAKMVTKYKQNGPQKQGGVGIKYQGNGKDGGAKGGMKPKQQGAAKGGLAQKPVQAKANGMVGNSIYKQNG